MKAIKATPDIAYEHMAGRTFMMRPQYGLTGDNDWLTAAMTHDSHHAFTGKSGVSEEKKASSFAIGVALKIGLSEGTIQALCTDVKFGHKPAQNSPYKLKKKSR